MAADEQTRVQQRLDTLTASSLDAAQVVQNVWGESRLPVDAAEGILRGVLAVPDAADSVEAGYVAGCRRHTLEGPGSGGQRPTRFGRVVTEDRLASTLREVGPFDTKGDAKAAIRRWKSPSYGRVSRKLRGFPVGQYLMWATYNADERDANPFDALPTDAAGLRDWLGLGHVPDGSPVLVLVYELAAGAGPLFPTVADAQMSPYFRPAPDGPGIESGLTHPLTSIGEPQPEVVH